MKILIINSSMPKRILLTTILATSIAAGTSALNTTSKNGLEKQNFEVVDKTVTDKFISTIKNIDDYDTKVIDKVSGNKEEYFTKENKTIIRILMGIVMSVIGGMVGNLRGEKGKKHIAKSETASNLGFASGFILPGITACTVFAVSVGVLLKSLGSSIIRK